MWGENMYSVGDYVVKVNDGVCRVEEITQLQMSGVSSEKLYYLLVPVNNKGSRIFVPAEDGSGEKAGGLRSVVESDRLEQILEKISEMDIEWIPNNKLRELKYKEVFQSADLELMVGYIKCMYKKRQEREALGKRNTALDERYLKQMEEAVYAEFAFSLGCEKSLIKEKIVKLF